MQPTKPAAAQPRTKTTANLPAQVLKETFGYDTYRPLQREVIENVLAGRDTLAIMPTGGGKSLCYQIPALIFDGLTVVVSPLIALMKDQVEQLLASGVPAVVLNSSISGSEYYQNMQAVRSGQVKLLYVAPETLLTTRIFDLLSEVKLSLLTIDEAHCISEWGHDFRPEYRQLINVREKFPQAVCLALTATATTRVRSDIKSSLKFSQPNEFVASFNRENLFIEVWPKEDPVAQTVRFVSRFKDQSGIIYCFSRRQVDELSSYLDRHGFSVRPYHAGLTDLERKNNQEAFVRDDVQIIVATIAFGMGINKPNVRFVLHFDLPKNIEGYYQEIGRAGRDGLPAHCLLLYSYSDVAKIRYFIDQKTGTERMIAAQHLDALVRYAENENTCRRKPLLNYFGEVFEITNCGQCDNCTTAPAPLVEVTIPAQKFMSCVVRTGERFGAGYVADVLLGSKDQRILTNGHDALSTYGIGSEYKRDQWMQLGRQLVQMEYLSVEAEFQTLHLTPKGSEALRGRKPIFCVRFETETKREKAQAASQEPEYNHALYALLRQKRKELADQAGVPPYVIFSDRTLVEMAAFYPQSSESLLRISGIGRVKRDQYGEPFLDLIQAFCQKHRLAENLDEAKPAPRKRSSERIDRSTQVGRAYNEGQSLETLAEQYQVQPGTILNHLAKYTESGQPLRLGDDLLALSTLTESQQQQVRAAFAELGVAYLRPVFERFGGSLDYEVLKIERLLYLINHSSG